jgi:hypothetical protein
MLRPTTIPTLSICASLLIATAASAPVSASQFNFQAVLDQQTQEMNATPSTEFSAADFPYEDLAKSLGIPSFSDRADAALLAIYVPTFDPIAPATDTNILSASALTDVPSDQSLTNISQVAPFPTSPGDN